MYKFQYLHGVSLKYLRSISNLNNISFREGCMYKLQYLQGLRGIVHFHPVYFPVKQGLARCIPALCYEPKSRDDFLLKLKFFRQGTGFGRYPTQTPTTTPLPEKSWLK